TRAERRNMSLPRRRRASGTTRRCTSPSAAAESRQRTASWLTLAQHEADASDRVNQPRGAERIDLLAQPGHLHVDHVVEGSGAARLFPRFTGKHLPRDEVALIPQQVLQQLELPDRQVERSVTPRGPARDEIEFQIGRLESKNL